MKRPSNFITYAKNSIDKIDKLKIKKNNKKAINKSVKEKETTVKKNYVSLNLTSKAGIVKTSSRRLIELIKFRI